MGGSFGSGGYRFDGDAPQDFEDDFAGTDYGGSHDDFDDRNSSSGGAYYGDGFNDDFDDDLDSGYNDGYNGSYSDGMADDFDDYDHYDSRGGYDDGFDDDFGDGYDDYGSRGRGGYDEGYDEGFDDDFGGGYDHYSSRGRGGYNDGSDDHYGNVNYDDFEDPAYYSGDARHSRSASRNVIPEQRRHETQSERYDRYPPDRPAISTITTPPTTTATIMTTRIIITAGTEVPPTARLSRFLRFTPNISAQETEKAPTTRSITARPRKKTTRSACGVTAGRSVSRYWELSRHA